MNDEHQIRWTVDQGVCRWRVCEDNGAWFAPDQFCQVKALFHPMGGVEFAPVAFERLQAIAAEIKKNSGLRRFGTASSHERRNLCLEFADALNSEAAQAIAVKS